MTKLTFIPGDRPFLKERSIGVSVDQLGLDEDQSLFFLLKVRWVLFHSLNFVAI